VNSTNHGRPRPLDVPATVQPVFCPVCKRPALMPEAALMRLPYTTLFRCPNCRTVAVVETTDGAGEARAA
jgi:hypothetical protein